jgi:hypothetical protein
MSNNISEDDWKVVEARLESMPEEMCIGILSHAFTKRELTIEVKNRTEVGTAYASMQLRFITWLLKQSKII